MQQKTITQNTPEWLQLRKNKVGASDAPVIMGVSPWKTPFQLWQQKLDLVPDEPTTPSQQYGIDMEEIARQAYQSYTNIPVRPKVVFHPDQSFMMASLDGLSSDGKIAVEIKNVKQEDHQSAKSGRIPKYYYPQLQHQMACLELPEMHYFSYKPNDSILVVVRRDDKYIENLYEEEKKFYNYVENLETPPLTDKDYVNFDDQEWNYTALEWMSISKRMDMLDKRQDELRSILIGRANNQNAQGGGVKLTQVLRKGQVDYKSIPELIGVDLERYRKDRVESWRISYNK